MSTPSIHVPDGVDRSAYLRGLDEGLSKAHSSTARALATYLLCVSVILAGYVGWWVFSSYQESAAYNRLTGANTTTWDAMFVQLRVQEGTK